MLVQASGSSAGHSSLSPPSTVGTPAAATPTSNVRIVICLSKCSLLCKRACACAVASCKRLAHGFIRVYVDEKRQWNVSKQLHSQRELDTWIDSKSSGVITYGQLVSCITVLDVPTQVSAFATPHTPGVGAGGFRPPTGTLRSASTPQYRDSPTWPSMSPLGVLGIFALTDPDPTHDPDTDPDPVPDPDRVLIQTCALL